MILNLADLAEHVGAREPTTASVARRIYKDTICGAGFASDAASITIAGYVEGIDADCPGHRLAFPFEGEAFDAALRECEAEADELWKATHGCEECGLDGAMRPDCPSCGGDGTVI